MIIVLIVCQAIVLAAVVYLTYRIVQVEKSQKNIDKFMAKYYKRKSRRDNKSTVPKYSVTDIRRAAEEAEQAGV